MKKIVASIVTAFALIGSASAYAQADAASTAAANELFESMHYRDMMVGLMHQMSQNIGSSMRAGAEAAIKANAKMSEEEKQKALSKLDAEMPVAVAKMQGVLDDPTLV